MAARGLFRPRVSPADPKGRLMSDRNALKSALAAVARIVLLVLLCVASPLPAAEIPDCQRMLLNGEYAECLKATEEALKQNRYGEAWPILKAQAELLTGQSEAANQTVATALTRYNWSVRLRWLGREAALRSGNAEAGQKFFDEAKDLSEKFAWRYTDAEEMVVLGRVDLLNGIDARDVLDKRFERAKQRNPRSRDAWLAIGELSLDKHDDALAADVFRAALKLFPEDPDMHFGLGRALMSSDPKLAAEQLDAAI